MALLELHGASKSFGAVKAIEDVDLELHAGEVHCLAGENGAGKSTIIKVLTGAIRRDSGTYEVDGEELGHPGPAEARAAGIGVVYQELSLLPELSVQENLLMGRLPSRHGLVRGGALRERAKELLARVGLEHVDPGAQVDTLPPATRQLIEVAKVLAGDTRVIVFDEPTTALSGDEAHALLQLIGELREGGVSVLYVSHRLEEMFEIGDRVTVLRDGKVRTTGAMADFDHDSLIAAMVGRKIESLYPAGKAREPGKTLLKATGLQVRGADAPVDLEVREGEILGIGGLLGSGRTELLRALFGADPVAGGEIEVDGKRIAPGDPRRFVRAGVGLLTEDRKELGLLLELTIRENASIADLDEISQFTLVSRKREAGVVDRFLDGLRLRRRLLLAAGLVAVGRQPAEGAARPLAGQEGEGAAVRRADQGRRRRRQVGDLRADRRPRGGRPRRRRRVVVPARAARAVRPDRRDARRAPWPARCRRRTRRRKSC